MFWLHEYRDAILVTTAFFTPLLAGVIGLGGGIALMAVMAIYLPPPQIVPD